MQATNIYYILIKFVVVSRLLSFQLLIYYYYCLSLLNFELYCLLIFLLLQYTIVFVFAFVFNINFLIKSFLFQLARSTALYIAI